MVSPSLSELLGLGSSGPGYRWGGNPPQAGPFPIRANPMPQPGSPMQPVMPGNNLRFPVGGGEGVPGQWGGRPPVANPIQPIGGQSFAPARGGPVSPFAPSSWLDWKHPRGTF